MNNTGMGVLLGYLGGNEETVNALKSSLNKTIKSIYLDSENDELNMIFTDDSHLVIKDDGQSCCEHRFMSTDDDLDYYVGSQFINIEITGGECDNEDEYGGCDETQFLDITTSKGVFQMVNHNSHNGYYGGFWIIAYLKNNRKDN